MRFFDLVSESDTSLEGLAHRLGYKKIFVVGKDVQIIQDLRNESKSKKIVSSESSEVLTKALKSNEVIGVLPKGEAVSRKTLDMIKVYEKVLLLPFAPITCANPESRIHKLAKMRSVVKNALRARVPICIVSLAENKEGLMSTAQMVEVANFFGMEKDNAKKALNVLGGLL